VLVTVTDTQITTASVPSTIPEDTTSLIISIEPHDRFNNPTNHNGDGFHYYWDDDDDESNTITDLTGTTIDKPTEGTSLLHITLNGVEIDNSPFAVTTQKARIAMPAVAMITLIIAIALGGGQFLFIILSQLISRHKTFIARQSNVNLAFAIYSRVDWSLDVYFVSRAFARGYVASERRERAVRTPVGATTRNICFARSVIGRNRVA